MTTWGNFSFSEDLILLLIVVVKAVFVMLGALLPLAAGCIWVERKGSALIQDRIGANRASFWNWDLAGAINTLVCDPVKAIMKEDWVPTGANQFIHAMGPFMAVFPVLLSFAVVPFGPPFKAGDVTVTMQLADLNVGVLYVFAMGSLAVYGVVIAGWCANNKFSLLGSLRASAQMISYEVTMGLSIVGMLVIYRSLDLNKIIEAQAGTFAGIIPRWGIFLYPPFSIIAFLIFFTSMMAETKRAPFDLPESESEIVAGYLTEYSGMKFLLFWLGEFSEIVVASTVVVIMFFGGWQLPGIDYLYWNTTADFKHFPIPDLAAFFGHFQFTYFWWNPSWLPYGSILASLVLLAKVIFFCVLQIIIRWTLPRFRYDQLMSLCWKLMLPVCLVNLVGTVAAYLWFNT